MINSLRILHFLFFRVEGFLSPRRFSWNRCLLTHCHWRIPGRSYSSPCGSIFESNPQLPEPIDILFRVIIELPPATVTTEVYSLPLIVRIDALVYRVTRKRIYCLSFRSLRSYILWCNFLHLFRTFLFLGTRNNHESHSHK